MCVIHFCHELFESFRHRSIDIPCTSEASSKRASTIKPMRICTIEIHSHTHKQTHTAPHIHILHIAGMINSSTTSLLAGETLCLSNPKNHIFCFMSRKISSCLHSICVLYSDFAHTNHTFHRLVHVVLCALYAQRDEVI